MSLALEFCDPPGSRFGRQLGNTELNLGESAALDTRWRSLLELATSTTVVFSRRNKPVDPRILLKTLLSVSPSSPLKLSSSRTISHLVNNARASACFCQFQSYISDQNYLLPAAFVLQID